MTIAISLKVNDGLVLATDSASTLVGRDPAGNTSVVNIYNSANKIFNLRKGLPIGAITWGAGGIGTASVSTLAKDLRRRFAGQDPQHDEWGINPSSYTIEAVANKLKTFMYDELYVPAFRDWHDKPDIGFIVAGYSSGDTLPEEYQIDITQGVCEDPRLLRPKADCGVTWSGEPEAIFRLVLGHGTGLPLVLANLGVRQDQIEPAMGVIHQALQIPFVMPAMPFQDAIDLAEFLVDLTIKFSKFAPGPPTVGGPIEIAAISKHEGFKWIRRKHYYKAKLNPSD